MTPPTPVLAAACGIRVARRGAPAAPVDADLKVGVVHEVAIPTGPSLDARSPEGESWRRLWSLPDRLVLEFVNLVAIEVADRDGTVVFDRMLPPDTEDHLLLDHVLPLWLARRGHIVLHGGVLVRDGRAVVVTGHSGAGKSTLTAFLGERDWSIGGDDAAVVRREPPLTVEATYATVRLTPDAVGLLGMAADVGVAVAGKRRIDPPPTDAQHGPVALSAVARINPVGGSSTAGFERVRGAAALNLLLSNTFHVDLGPGAHLAGLLEGLAQVVESAVVGELSVPRGREGLAAVDSVLTDVLAS